MIVKYACRHKNTSNLPGSIYIITTFMEKGIPREEKPSIDSKWSIYQDIQDVKLGLKTFEELRQAWVAWARQALQELESQADTVNHADLPDPNSADTTA